jgi:hypothetical protein
MDDEFFICVENMADFELEVGWQNDAVGGVGRGGVGTIGSTNVGFWNAKLGGFKRWWLKNWFGHASLRYECALVVRR